MAANGNPTVRRRRLGAELRRLRLASGLTGAQVAAELMVSQPKISLLENGLRAISPRDVRELCGLYKVTDPQAVDSLMRMARESGRQGWWAACGEVPYSVYIGLESEAAAICSYEPLVIPGLLQTPAYAAAVIAETIPWPRPNRPPRALRYGCAGSTASTTRPGPSASGRCWTNRHCTGRSAAPPSCVNSWST